MIQRREFLTLPALAALASTRAAAQASPIAPIQGFTQALLAIMKAGKATPFAQRVATLKPAMAAAFDLEAILRASVGLHWATMPDSTKTDLLAAFTDFTIATWVANFDTFDGERIEVGPDTRKVGTDEVVQTRIVPKEGDTTRLDYVMRNTAGMWRAVDILVDGSISRVAIQRSDFRSVLARSDAALISMLRSKAADLAAGVK